jgi:hypothetical protein
MDLISKYESCGEFILYNHCFSTRILGEPITLKITNRVDLAITLPELR